MLLGLTQKRILALLWERRRTRDELAVTLGVAPNTVNGKLRKLAAKGLVANQGGYWSLPHPAPPAPSPAPSPQPRPAQPSAVIPAMETPPEATELREIVRQLGDLLPRLASYLGPEAVPAALLAAAPGLAAQAPHPRPPPTRAPVAPTRPAARPVAEPGRAATDTSLGSAILAHLRSMDEPLDIFVSVVSA